MVGIRMYDGVWSLACLLSAAVSASLLGDLCWRPSLSLCAPAARVQLVRVQRGVRAAMTGTTRCNPAGALSQHDAPPRRSTKPGARARSPGGVTRPSPSRLPLPLLFRFVFVPGAVWVPWGRRSKQPAACAAARTMQRAPYSLQRARRAPCIIPHAPRTACSAQHCTACTSHPAPRLGMQPPACTSHPAAQPPHSPGRTAPPVRAPPRLSRFLVPSTIRIPSHPAPATSVTAAPRPRLCPVLTHDTQRAWPRHRASSQPVLRLAASALPAIPESCPCGP